MRALQMIKDMVDEVYRQGMTLTDEEKQASENLMREMSRVFAAQDLRRVFQADNRGAPQVEESFDNASLSTASPPLSGDEDEDCSDSGTSEDYEGDDGMCGNRPHCTRQRHTTGFFCSGYCALQHARDVVQLEANLEAQQRVIHQAMADMQVLGPPDLFITFFAGRPDAPPPPSPPPPAPPPLALPQPAGELPTSPDSQPTGGMTRMQHLQLIMAMVDDDIGRDTPGLRRKSRQRRTCCER